MNKVRATLAVTAVTAVTLGALALPTAAGAQEIVPDDLLLQWTSYDAFAQQTQDDVMRQLITGRADAGSKVTADKATPFEVKKTIEVQDAQSPIGVVVAAVEQTVGLD